MKFIIGATTSDQDQCLRYTADTNPCQDSGTPPSAGTSTSSSTNCDLSFGNPDSQNFGGG